MITASQVKDLRERTGAGMMDCKKVLTETDGDVEKAIELLRERGLSKAAKKSGRIARSIRDTAYKILKFKDEYLLKNGIEPKNDIICKSLDITDYDLELALNSLKEPMSIFEPIYNDGGDTIYLADQIADIKNTNEDRDTLISLRKALLKIKQRERNILTDRYIVGKTQSEIASELGVSQAQISRIEKSAINNVKRLIK